MKTFVCQVCGHIAFDQAPVECPVCTSPIEHFENDPDAIKAPADADNLTESDRKHIPHIELGTDCTSCQDNPCTAVTVSVGEIEHVMESEHFITFIDFYIDRKYIARVLLTAKHNHASATMHFTLKAGMLSVVAHCNVHGCWRAKKRIGEIPDQEP
jgi:superoxide reductase